MISMIKNIIFVSYSLVLLGGGAYVGWGANTMYVHVTTDPMGFIVKAAGGK